MPPSTRNVDAVTYEASSLARNSAPWAISSARAKRRRVHRPRAERVDADAAPGELDAQLAREGEHPALRRRVGDLRRRRAEHRDERRGVDHRAAACLEQVRDAVLAAQEHALEVDVLHALPGL